MAAARLLRATARAGGPLQEAIAAGNEAAADDLPELHATLSGMKAMGTVWAHESIEECRKCCGGQVIAASQTARHRSTAAPPRHLWRWALQGFLMSSGIAKILPDFAEWVTVEGEQVRLMLSGPDEPPRHRTHHRRMHRTIRLRFGHQCGGSGPVPWRFRPGAMASSAARVRTVWRAAGQVHPIATA